MSNETGLFSSLPVKFMLAALIAGLAMTYVRGLWVPLMDLDAAHHACIALHMHLSGDYFSLIDRGADYLDKPHFLFWLAALAFKLFGPGTMAYKIGSVLFSALGIYSTYRLGRILYSPDTGRLAALLLASALAFVLSNQDVRMDAVLTAAAVFAVWQWVEFLQHRRIPAFLLACTGMAISFATKGAVGIVLPAMAVFFYLLYRRDWRQLINPQWMLAALITLIMLTPVLYAYYQQFDLHPEKMIRGQQGVSGLRFILLGQSMERFEGSSWGGGGGDPTFFLGTFLWAFLPWSLPALAALFSQLIRLVRERFRYVAGTEALTAGAIFPFFLLISAAGYQLPHYINILFPFWAIVTAQYLLTLPANVAAGWMKVQLIIYVLLVLLALSLNTIAFMPQNALVIAMAAGLLGIFVLVLVWGGAVPVAKLVLAGLSAAVLTNFLFNFNFYPQVLSHQAGPVLAAEYGNLGLSSDSLYYLEGSETSFSFEFYSTELLRTIDPAEPEEMAAVKYIYTGEEGLSRLGELGTPYRILAEARHFHVSMLKPRFLNPATRVASLSRHYIVQLMP